MIGLSSGSYHIVQCDGAPLPSGLPEGQGQHLLALAINDAPGLPHNIALSIADFDQVVQLVDERSRDLLDIASYVYAADRLITRGSPNQMEYANWSRQLVFCIGVRDVAFWSQPQVVSALRAALLYLSGDKDIQFHFTKRGPESYQTRLFSSPPGIPASRSDVAVVPPEVALFSGGLDSLAGILNLLETTSGKVVLTSHQANRKTTNVQQHVYSELQKAYPERLLYFPLDCHLTDGKRAAEETQRTRFFLYTAVAFSLARVYNLGHINIFENGVTSINLPKRQDLLNARASRTTHPKAIRLLNAFYSLVAGSPFVVKHPFLGLTKTEVVELIVRYQRQDLIAATVTCTKTFKSFEHRSHARQCGYCSQCVDRRFAVFAAGLGAQHDTIYDFDLTVDSFPSDNLEARTHVNDYLHQAATFAEQSYDNFENKYFDELTELVDSGLGMAEETRQSKEYYELFRRHSQKVVEGYQAMVKQHTSPLKPLPPDSIYTFVDSRTFLLPEVARLAERISERMKHSIPIALQRQKPDHENGLNDLIEALLNAERENYKREFPSTPFAFSKVIPDHTLNGVANTTLHLEAKYLRRDTPPSKITDQLVADLGKYPANDYTLFLIYDPERRIADDDGFCQDIESRKKNGCKVCIMR